MVRPTPAALLRVAEECPFGVELAGGVQVLQLLISMDQMDPHVAVAFRLKPLRLNKFVQQLDRPKVLYEAGIEAVA